MTPNGHNKRWTNRIEFMLAVIQQRPKWASYPEENPAIHAKNKKIPSKRFYVRMRACRHCRLLLNFLHPTGYGFWCGRYALVCHLGQKTNLPADSNAKPLAAWQWRAPCKLECGGAQKSRPKECFKRCAWNEGGEWRSKEKRADKREKWSEGAEWHYIVITHLQEWQNKWCRKKRNDNMEKFMGAM